MESAPPANHAGQIATALEFFPRWETRRDASAYQMFRDLSTHCRDFAACDRLAPAGSESRALLLRFFDSFEEAGNLIRSGRMSEALFFETWYALPRAWLNARMLIDGLRRQTANPALYEAFEWLSHRAGDFWAQREKRPSTWRPLDYPDPTDDDRLIFATFDRVSARSPESWALLDEIRSKQPSYAEFRQRLSAGAHAYIVWDALLCYYERAGVLVKSGVLHPKLLFASWRSPIDVWAIARPYVLDQRKRTGSPHLYENIDWLAAYESAWRRR